MTDLSSTIATNAAGPASASGDTGSMTQHSLPDQIEADKYLAAKTAMSSSTSVGLRFIKIKPGSAL